ncbi:MAG: malate synthase G, partial [SAR324 cluster bacterium]|nr:malate synthase G [SAR324 cluster bacterium]
MNTEKRVTIGSLSIDPALEALVREEIMPGLGLNAEDFWNSFSQILNDLTPRNRELLEKRDRIQQQIDEWHLNRMGKPHDPQAYQEFLRSIDYLVTEGPDFKITTTGVDPEISQIPGPQLVVPV